MRFHAHIVIFTCTALLLPSVVAQLPPDSVAQHLADDVNALIDGLTSVTRAVFSLGANPTINQATVQNLTSTLEVTAQAILTDTTSLVLAPPGTVSEVVDALDAFATAQENLSEAVISKFPIFSRYDATPLVFEALLSLENAVKTAAVFFQGTYAEQLDRIFRALKKSLGIFEQTRAHRRT